MKKKAWITTALFLITIFGFGIAYIICPDTEISISERRTLKQTPEISLQVITDGSFFDEFEEYLQDQFPLRESLRTVKAVSEYYIYMKADNNDIYLYNGFVCKQDYPLDAEAVEEAADKINEIYYSLFEGLPAYYSVIPDKNYFLAEESGHLCYDYTELFEIMKGGVNEEISYIDICPMLSIEQYYKTDLHWKQEQIIPVADHILDAMGEAAPQRQYEQYNLEPFYGSYFGQAALPIAADRLTYLTNDTLNSCIVYDPLKETYSSIYEVGEFGGIDSYDVFLSGAQSILIITNPNNTTGKELYIVRDSFSSCLTPLLIENYSKIVLIDPRYVAPNVVSKYISPGDNATVLFVFSTTILNKGYLFR